MWIDDVYMSVPFLIRYADVDPEAETLDEACRQMLVVRSFILEIILKYPIMMGMVEV